MPTTKRKCYIGVCYRVTSRGNHRNDNFRDGEELLYYFNQGIFLYKYILYKIFKEQLFLFTVSIKKKMKYYE